MKHKHRHQTQKQVSVSTRTLTCFFPEVSVLQSLYDKRLCHKRQKLFIQTEPEFNLSLYYSLKEDMMNLIPLLLVVDWISGIANVALRSRAITTTSHIWKQNR